MNEITWSYPTSKEELVNHPKYSKPVVMKKMGVIHVTGYERAYLWGLIKTRTKIGEKTIWDAGYSIYELKD